MYSTASEGLCACLSASFVWSGGGEDCTVGIDTVANEYLIRYKFLVSHNIMSLLIFACVSGCIASQHIMTDLGKLLSPTAGQWLQNTHTHTHIDTYTNTLAHTLKGPHLPLSLAVEILSAVCTSHKFCSSSVGHFIGCGGGGVEVHLCECVC